VQASQPAQAIAPLQRAIVWYQTAQGAGRVSPASAARSISEAATLLAQVFDDLQQPDSVRRYRALAAAHATP
jgi:hypothetical protein